MKKMREKQPYTTPCLEVLELFVEAGFALSEQDWTGNGGTAQPMSLNYDDYYDVD